VDSGRHGSLRGGPEILRDIGDKGPPFRCRNNILVTLLGTGIIEGGMRCISLALARLAQLRSSVSWLFLYSKELTPYLGLLYNPSKAKCLNEHQREHFVDFSKRGTRHFEFALGLCILPQ
jgi:hypothetical protein